MRAALAILFLVLATALVIADVERMREDRLIEGRARAAAIRECQADPYCRVIEEKQARVEGRDL